MGLNPRPNNGVTYGYNMVGANPNTCSGSACNATIQTDITPIIVNVAGMTFSGSDVLAATLASPQFALNDYGTTPAATGDVATESRGAGGALSQLDAGRLLQLQDATKRAPFNKVGKQQLSPSTPCQSPAGGNDQRAVQPGDPAAERPGRGLRRFNYSWWGAQIKNLSTKADPTHLPLYLTSDLLLHVGPNILNCCVIGFHGATSNAGSQGNAKVQTFAWASYMSPGIYARPDGGANWALQDIHALSHEIAEWADDPFVNNWVEPWLTPTAPQYGCTNILETGDPVVGIGFAMGINTFLQNPNPWTSPTNHNPSVSYDGFWHPEDEALLPWFMRSSPNLISEPTQSPSANIGRCTFMGDLIQHRASVRRRQDAEGPFRRARKGSHESVGT